MILTIFGSAPLRTVKFILFDFKPQHIYKYICVNYFNGDLVCPITIIQEISPFHNTFTYAYLFLHNINQTMLNTMQTNTKYANTYCRISHSCRCSTKYCTYFLCVWYVSSDCILGSLLHL